MEKISLSKFVIPKNYVLIKPDPDFEFVEVKPESGIMINNEPVKIWIGYTSETHAKHFSITGTIVALPETLLFNKERIKKFKQGRGNDISRQVGVSILMESSLQIEVDIETKVGDKVWFDYLCQINAVVHKLIIDTEEHGLCFLIWYDDIYCYERDGEVQLINGWVWIQRLERETERESGIHLELSEKNKYERNKAVVVKAAKPIRQYMDSISEDQVDLKGGEQIIYNDSFGHPLEYSIHRKLTDKEVLSIRRKHIYAVV